MNKLKLLAATLILSVVLPFSAFAATQIGLNLEWKYAGNSAINTGKAVLYTTDVKRSKGVTVAVNAGHGTKGGSSVKTLCHPDGSRKVTGGSTDAGSVWATAVSEGMTFHDGTKEADVTLELAHILGKKLLADGYDVLMLRTDDDVQLDNVARTVIADNKADCHIALHWDSTSKNKGAFYISTPDELKKMSPVAENWQKHEKLGSALISGLKSENVKIFSSGSMDLDLTQTAYSTIPSVDIELGDRASSHSEQTLNTLADGLLAGVNQYYAF